MIDAKIKCCAPWAGGKRTLAPRIVELLGPHTYYAEPFVGGCSILPAKPQCATERVNDKNDRITNVLRQLGGDGFKAERLKGILFEQSAYDFARGYLSSRGLNVHSTPEDAAQQLVAWWMGPNGTAGTTVKGWFAKRHTATGGSPAVRWESFKASVPALAERLKGVDVTWNDFRLFLARVPDFAGAAIYADPPYFTKEFSYSHDFKPRDHEDLARILNSYDKTRIVVSYRDEIEGGLLGGGSLLDELYPPAKWRRIEVEMSKNMASASGTAKRNTEVLLVNDAANSMGGVPS